MKLPVQPRLFDIILMYASAIERGEVKPGRLAATSPALVFCENFYAQFFQNEIGREITSFTQDTKKDVVRVRLRLKKKKTPRATMQLITWFEKLCDIYPTVLAMGYGKASPEAFVEFHKDYLTTLLARAEAWAKTRKFERLEAQAGKALEALECAVAHIEA